MPSVILQTAMGVPLQRIPDVRRFFGAMDETDVVDFDGPLPAVKTHVIAARITAENPDDVFKPCGGRVDRISIDQWSQVFITHEPTHARRVEMIATDHARDINS